MTVRLVSLGAWCRPAHQLRVHAGAQPHCAAPSGPFDWTITPFAALRACLDPGFDPGTVLAPGAVAVSHVGSGLCRNSGLIFHHAIAPRVVVAAGPLHPGDPLPDDGPVRAAVAEARDRFRHVFARLSVLRRTTDRIVFLRWQRQGHPDARLPAAFAGESPAVLRQALEGFLGHGGFHLLTMRSEILTDRRKRRGWNGDQTDSFKGDEHSWGAALERALGLWTRAGRETA